MEKSLLEWGIFFSVIAILLILDLGVFHKKSHALSSRESLFFTAFYFVIGLLFGKWIWFHMGKQAALEYYTAFLVEKSLSLDNIFVISLIFTHFKIPSMYQHRVLFWGIMGAIIFRGLMIAGGTIAIERFQEILYFFAAFLIFTGLKIFFVSPAHHTKPLEKTMLWRFLKKYLPISKNLHGEHFWIKEKKWLATPLFLALVFIEGADVIFAVDSIPAVFAITQEPYIVYTSNIFAILGLRALYFALNNVIHRFEHMKYALSLILIFIGGKIFFGELGFKLSPAVSLGITVAFLMWGFVYSLYKTRKTPV